MELAQGIAIGMIWLGVGLSALKSDKVAYVAFYAMLATVAVSCI